MQQGQISSCLPPPLGGVVKSTISGTDEDWIAGVCDVDGCGYDSIEGSVDRLDCVKETDDDIEVDMADRVGEEEQWYAWVDVDRVEIALVTNTDTDVVEFSVLAGVPVKEKNS